MEQKAKRIGKLNIIDLLAILLIAAVLVLAAWKFIGRNGDSIDYERPQTKVTYQVKVEGVAPELYARSKRWKSRIIRCWTPTEIGSRIRTM